MTSVHSTETQTDDKMKREKFHRAARQKQNETNKSLKKETSAAKNSTLHGSNHILLDRLACL